MRYFILSFGIFMIVLITIINFQSDNIINYVDDKLNKKEIVVEENEYFIDEQFSFIKNYTDDVNNKEELINYIYYVINSGATLADGECTEEYSTCTTDLEQISNDQELLSLLNNYVHPFNSFKTIKFTYSDRGTFSLEISHIYSDEDIKQINTITDKIIDENVYENMSNSEKVKAIHDYIIENTDYDELKYNNINDTTYRSNTAYGVLVEHFGICSGYADTTFILLHKLGITNYKISNDSHVWNLVYINGKWLHLDTTWDDPIYANNPNRDNYFLIDTKTLNSYQDNEHYFNSHIFTEALN